MSLNDIIDVKIRMTSRLGTRDWLQSVPFEISTEVKYVHVRTDLGTIALYLAGSHGERVSIAARAEVGAFVQRNGPISFLFSVHRARLVIPATIAEAIPVGASLAVATWLTTVPVTATRLWIDEAGKGIAVHIQTSDYLHANEAQSLGLRAIWPEKEWVYDPYDRT